VASNPAKNSAFTRRNTQVAFLDTRGSDNAAFEPIFTDQTRFKPNSSTPL
jgi:hypothetical protein